MKQSDFYMKLPWSYTNLSLKNIMLIGTYEHQGFQEINNAAYGQPVRLTKDPSM